MKWVYKLNLRLNGEIAKYKVRLVARGFLQKPSIYFDEVYAPVARIEIIIIVMSTTTYKGWKIHQQDIKSTFLNVALEYEVYVSQSPGFEIKRHEQKVYKLRKTLYGLKQTPRIGIR